MGAGEIKTVIFDLGGVLAHLDGPRVVQALAELAGKEPAQVYAAFEQGMQTTIPDYERGLLNSLEVHRWALEALELTPEQYPYQLFCQLWCETIQPYPEMAALFRRCCAARKTCVLSNTNDLHWNWVAHEFDLLQRAAATLTSFECGYYKPEPEIYALALERFGVADPATAVFIDDREENIAAAVDAGMTASFVHAEVAETEARLAALGALEEGGA
jgi:HAD superfamily hydrolase (TIGR01509 family)